MRSEKNGRIWENTIESQLKSHNYSYIKNKRMVDILKNNSLDEISKKYYTRNFPLGEGLIPFLKRKEEFFILNSPKYPNGLLITAKWQQSPGSVYEKAPYVALNIKRYNPYPTIVLWDGDFNLKPVEGAYLYLRSEIGGKLVSVMRLNEFTAWANNGGF